MILHLAGEFDPSEVRSATSFSHSKQTGLVRDYASHVRCLLPGFKGSAEGENALKYF